MTLRARMVAAMLVVAVLAFGFAAVLTAPLVRSSAEDSARAALARQVDLLARLPRAQQLTDRLDARADVRGLNLGVVTRRGQVSGAATALTSTQVQDLLDGRSVSGSGELPDGPVLFEARPIRNGGAIVLATTSEEVDRAVTEQRRRLMLALALGLVVALGAGVVLAGYLSRPLTRLAETARRMGAGERGTVVPETSTREVDEVGEALHQLDVALRDSEGRQRRFLLSVSHELRTPLTAIRGYAESIEDGVTTPGEVPEVAATMLAEARRMERYVDDLLALARLDADDFDLRTTRFDAAELVEETATAWQERASRAGVRLEARVPDGGLPLDSDPVRVRQALDALLDNAVRVCPEGAVVVLAASRHGSGVRLQVRDSGPGLTEDDAAVAFEPGVLHERYAGQRPGGHGLGLALVYRLVTRLGGTIQVGIAAEGGAAFVVDLPDP